MWLQEPSLGGIKKSLAVALLLIAAAVVWQGTRFALVKGGGSVAATAFGAVAAGLFIINVVKSPAENKCLKILQVLAFWGFLQVGICWGLLIPLFYALSFVAIIVGLLDTNWDYLKLFISVWIILSVGFLLHVLPLCSVGACRLDVYNRVVTSMIFLIVGLFILGVLKFFSQRAYVVGALVDESLMDYLVHGLVALSMLHAIKNALSYLDEDKTALARVKAFLSWYFMQIYNIYVSVSDLVKAIVHLNDLLRAIYVKRFLTVETKFPPKCLGLVDPEHPLLGGIVLGVVAELIINAYKHTAGKVGKVGSISIKCKSGRLCIEVDNIIIRSNRGGPKRGIGLQLSKILLKWLTKNNYSLRRDIKRSRNIARLCVLRE